MEQDKRCYGKSLGRGGWFHGTRAWSRGEGGRGWHALHDIDLVA